MENKRFPNLIQLIPARIRTNRWILYGLIGIAIILILVFPLIKFQQSTFWIRVVGYAGLYILLGLGLNVVVGFAGLLDLGYVAFYAIGAYTYAILASSKFNIHISFWLVIPIAAILAAIAGILLGIPVLRLRGDYLAIVTLGFGEIIRILVTNLRDLTNGTQGLIGIDPPTFFGITLKGGFFFYYLIFAFVVLVAFITNRLNHSRVGRAWVALREDEDVVQMMGVNATYVKLLAFSIGAMIGGIGGAIFSAWQGSIFPDNFNLFVSINVLSLIIIGGMGSIPGVIIGAFALIALPDILREFSDYRMLLFGFLLIVMMIVRPEGFIPSRRRKMELHESDMGNKDAILSPASGEQP
jgi:branched-chain amino acid transport system permease protein